MSEKSLVSIIVNCHNGERYLENCLKSIFSQHSIVMNCYNGEKYSKKSIASIIQL